MPRKRLVTDLFVYMNNQNVGRLSKLSSGQLEFIYDPHWLKNEIARPISLSLPLQEQPYKGDLVYHYFDNLLPDNESIRSRIQKRLGTRSDHCFDLLSAIGRDCVGAIQLLSEPLNAQAKIAATPLSEYQIASLLKNYREAPLGMQQDSDFRISIAGAQEKTALLKYQDKWCLPTHETPTTHIFKLPIGKIVHSGIDLSESVENEWLCLKILEAFNLPVNQATIMTFEDVKVLICERFDRKWNDDHSILFRLPQEDMCQVFGVSSVLKYESDGGPGIQDIMERLNGSHHAKSDRHHFFKACFLFWVLGAIDGHAKNFSVFLQPQNRFQLTPFYDVLSAYPLADKRQLDYKKLKMAMSVRGKNKHYHWNEILKRHWSDMAALCKFPELHFIEIYDEVFDNLDAVIDKVASNLPPFFPQSIGDSIFNGMKAIKNKNSH